MSLRTIKTASLLLITLLVSAPLTAAEFPPQVSERVAKAKAAAKKIDMAALKALLDGEQSVLLLDVREPNEFENGHIPGAINLPRGTLEFKIWKLVGGATPNMQRPVYVYCATAARSALATETLTQLGFTHAHMVDMQLEAWRKAGYPLEEAEAE